MKMNNMKNTASDFASDTVDRVADAFHHGQDVLGDTTKSVGDDVSKAATKVLHAASPSVVTDRLATVGRALAAAASARAIFGALTPAEPGRRLLAMMNLQRRPSGVSRVARGVGFVALGAAVGVGAALLLAPKTGAQMRARIRTLVRGASADAEHAAEALGAKAEGAAQKVEARVREAAHDIGTGIASMSQVTVENGLLEPPRMDASGPLSAEARARSRRLSDGAPKT
jgi:gas vesicle protein